MAARLTAFSSATEMLDALRARRVSAVELLALHRCRIDRHNAALNAVVVQDRLGADRAARRADRIRARRGLEAPLLGLPVTFKDWYAVAGLPTTAGDPGRAQVVADRDAPTVARIRAAGAVIIGKTNVPLDGADFQTDNPLFGRTGNPWNLERTAGGSTGGGAAALAAGLCPLALGSDRGGSIRVPAAFCGLYGHRPSETALPRTGVHPASLSPNPVTGMALQGPLARDARDLELAVDVMAGPDVGERTGWRLELPAARRRRLRDHRVAFLPLPDWLPLDPELRAALDRLARRLRRMGARVGRAAPEGFGDCRSVYALYLRLRLAMTSAARPEADRRREAGAYRGRGDTLFDAYAQGLEATAADYIAWHAEQERVRAAYRAFFQEWDVLVTPVTLTTAFPHDARPWAERRLRVDGREVAYDWLMVYPALASVCGQPATAFPLGLGPSGLPVGAQAIGPYLEDRTPIRFVELVGRELGGFVTPPGYEEPTRAR
jgi:amidase